MNNHRSDPLQPDTPLRRPTTKLASGEVVTITRENEIYETTWPERATNSARLLSAPCQHYAKASFCCYGYMMGRRDPCIVCVAQKECGIWCEKCGKWHGKSRFPKEEAK